MEQNYSFEGQRPDEEIIFVVKRHPWVLSKPGFIGVIVIIVLILAYLFFGASKITSILLVFFIIFVIAYSFYIWFLYNNYLSILTTQRLIIMEQAGLFSRKINESELDKIQNITVEVKGFIKTLLGFGDIKITTAGVDPVMVMQNIENPYKLQQEIAKYCKKMEKEVSRAPIIR